MPEYTYVVLVLHDFMIMKVHANNKCSHESRICTDGMSPGNPFAGQRELFVAILVIGRHGGGVDLRSKAIETVPTRTRLE